MGGIAAVSSTAAVAVEDRLNRSLQPTSGGVVPRFHSVRTELLIRRSRLSGRALAGSEAVIMHNKNSTSALLEGTVAVAVVATSISIVAQTTRNSFPSSLVLTAGRAGSFELGMTVDELIGQVGREHVRLVAKFPEGMFQPELEVDLPGLATGPALVAPIREWPCGEFALWGISVHDPRFRTANGLGVGSTLGDLRRHYPSVTVTNIDADGGPSVVITELGLTFAMERVPVYTDASRVESVWVFPQPVAVRTRKCPDRQ